MILREGEVKIISVTPVARGLVRPCLVAIVMLALVIFGAKHVHFIHQHEMLLGLIFAGPFALVALTQDVALAFAQGARHERTRRGRRRRVAPSAQHGGPA